MTEVVAQKENLVLKSFASKHVEGDELKRIPHITMTTILLISDFDTQNSDLNFVPVSNFPTYFYQINPSLWERPNCG